ncbi:MAG: ABC transporter substrate-binding protein [Streptosporangiaceae bacterium]
MKFRASAGAVALMLGGALVLAACGSSTSPGSSSASTTPAATSTTAGTGNYHPVSDYAGFVGGSGKADNSKSPIYIGVVNQQGGTADIAPEWTNGTTLAADFINNEAGGIDGHPVKLVTCAIPDTTSAAQQCGEEFANNNNIQSVAMGAVVIGNQPLEQALAPTDKPLVMGVTILPTDSTYKAGYILYGDATRVEAPIGQFIHQFLPNVKSVSIIYANVPGSNVPNEVIASTLEYYHITVKLTAFDPTSANITAPVIASGAATAGLVIDGAGNPVQCSDVYQALKQLNIKTPVLANVPCDSAVTAQGDGGALPVGWYYASANPLPGDPDDPSLAAFKTVADRYGDPTGASDAWVADAFGQVLTIAKVYNDILKSGGKITTATVNKGFKELKGAIPQGPPQLQCGSIAGAPAICNNEVSFFQNTSPGVFKAIARWISAPPGWTPPAGLF